MKYIKKFETLSTPKVGDYILANKYVDYNDHREIVKINIFINNNLGKIIDIIDNDTYVVKYDNIPTDIFRFFNHTKNNDNDNDKQYNNYRFLKLDDILYFLDKPFDIDIIKKSNKYKL